MGTAGLVAGAMGAARGAVTPASISGDCRGVLCGVKMSPGERVSPGLKLAAPDAGGLRWG